MARILITGIATLDHTLDVADFPAEDSEGRALGASTQPGGNAANTAYLLVQAGHRVDLAATVAAESAGDTLLDALRARGIGVDRCVRQPGQTPTSFILRARRTGSRTIVHHRDLPELEPAQWRPEGLGEYDWFHFEGRHPGALPDLMQAARHAAVDQPLSLELEKPREGLLTALPLADVLLFSRAWAEPDFADPEAFIAAAARQRPEAIQTLTWGRRGAWLAHRGQVFHCAAQPGLVVRDSLGAGDTFNAGLIDALVSGEWPERALTRAVRLAERKLGQVGLQDLFRPEHR